tara:strand:- start:6358 stop:7281 length:924 start_codon:yes stop_codon:yes gene_type:complete
MRKKGKVRKKPNIGRTKRSETSVVFSIYVDIPVENLDNPGWWENGVQVKTDKSLQTKNSLKAYYDRLNKVKKDYADNIRADYILFEGGKDYDKYCDFFKNNYPQISEYDIINFYKQWKMKDLAEQYDKICYLDFDVIPNTKEDIFKAHKINTHFACAENNHLASEGKRLAINDPDRYQTCIRNPASKYWNCHAMLSEEGYEPDTDVFNTGIMVATREIIKKLDYFGDFEKVLELMTQLKEDENSMYPPTVQRVFNYDNETVFAYKRVINEVDIDYINDDWHWRVDSVIFKKDAKMFHVMNKKFGYFL